MTDPCSHPAGASASLFRAVDYISGEEFEICRCGACGLVRTTPAPANIDAYYPTGYYGDRKDRRFPAPVEWFQNTLYRRRARAVERLAGKGAGRILDIGCGRGSLLQAFRKRGWEVQGTELSEPAAAYAREKLRLPVWIGPVERLPWPDGHFDAVVMWHVLEHLREPSTALREASRLLRPGGVFFVSVPNFESLEARLARDKWFHLDVPRHLIQFTSQTLGVALAAAGLEPRKNSYLAPEYDCFSLVQSALNLLRFRHNLLYDSLRGAGAKVLRGNTGGIVQTASCVALAAPLGLVSLPAILLAAMFRSGATVTVLAVKGESGRD